MLLYAFKKYKNQGHFETGCLLIDKVKKTQIKFAKNMYYRNDMSI